MNPIEDIFPCGCRICGAPPALADSLRLGAWPFLCAECGGDLSAIGDPRCALCGKPLVSERSTCIQCRMREYSFRGNLSLFLYAGRCRDLVQAYKFAGARRLAGSIASHLAGLLDSSEGYGGWREGAFTLVPVPSTRRKRRERGWDPVGLLALALARESRRGGKGKGISVKRLLVRLPGKEQKELDFRERCSNLRGKILIHRGPGMSAIPPAIILLDDIFTTGATLNECARVLLSAGASRIACVTVAVDP